MPKGIRTPIINGQKQCQRCGQEKPLDEFYGNHGCCKICEKQLAKNRYHQVDSAGKTRNPRTLEARLELKRKLVDVAGGCCTRCGYNKSIYALDFHRTGKDKENTVSNLLMRATGKKDEHLALALAEAAKCILLCANCHRELHAEQL